MARKTADIVTRDLGSLWAFYGTSRRGRNWLSKYVDDSAGRDEDEAIYTEPRYGIYIMMGALGTGLCLQDAVSGRFARGA